MKINQLSFLRIFTHISFKFNRTRTFYFFNENFFLKYRTRVVWTIIFFFKSNQLLKSNNSIKYTCKPTVFKEEKLRLKNHYYAIFNWVGLRRRCKFVLCIRLHRFRFATTILWLFFLSHVICFITNQLIYALISIRLIYTQQRQT